MATVYDLAEYILKKLEERDEAEVSTLKLQKLVYYSQAYSLVWDGKPIFDDPIEAWINGPVVRSLYDKHKGKLNVSSGFFGGNPDALTDDEKETVDAVLDAYGHLDAYSLVSLTHEELPWKEAREGFAPSERCNNEIPQAAMRDFYILSA